MSKITELEREVLNEMLAPLLGGSTTAAAFIDSIAIERREISTDVLDKLRCSGFYLHFASDASLATAHALPHHLSLHARHASSPAGADFILFFDQAKHGLDYLEATFFDSTFPIADVLSANHGFIIRDSA